MFLADPLEVPQAVVDYVGGQLAIADLSCAARYMERRSTRFEHADEIKRVFGLRDFALGRGRPRAVGRRAGLDDRRRSAGDLRRRRHLAG